jgi:hypothetical protein
VDFWPIPNDLPDSLPREEKTQKENKEVLAA